MKLKIAALTALMMASTCIYATPTRDTGELGISNQTRSPLSFTVNNVCSSDIGNVNGYSIKTISAATIIKACATYKCDIIGYSRPNCTGAALGGVIIDFANRKMEVISNHVNHIDVSGSIGLYEYNIFFNDHSRSDKSR